MYLHLIMCNPHFAADIRLSENAGNKCTIDLAKAEFESDSEANKKWKPVQIDGVTEFNATIGPTGGNKGYSAITGMWIVLLSFNIDSVFWFKMILKIDRSSLLGHCMVDKRRTHSRIVFGAGTHLHIQCSWGYCAKSFQHRIVFHFLKFLFFKVFKTLYDCRTRSIQPSKIPSVLHYGLI